MAVNYITGFEIGGQVRRVDYNHLANLPFLPFTFTAGTPVALAENVSVERVAPLPVIEPGGGGRERVGDLTEEPTGGLMVEGDTGGTEGLTVADGTTVSFSMAVSDARSDPLQYLKVVCDGKEFILCSETTIESTMPKSGDPVIVENFSAGAKECPVWVSGVMEGNGALRSGSVTIYYNPQGDTEESDDPIAVSVYALKNASFSMPHICSFDQATVQELTVQSRVDSPDVTSERMSSERVTTDRLYADKMIVPIYDYDYDVGERMIAGYRRLDLNNDGTVTWTECEEDGSEPQTQQEI